MARLDLGVRLLAAGAIVGWAAGWGILYAQDSYNRFPVLLMIVGILLAGLAFIITLVRGRRMLPGTRLIGFLIVPALMVVPFVIVGLGGFPE